MPIDKVFDKKRIPNLNWFRFYSKATASNN